MGKEANQRNLQKLFHSAYATLLFKVQEYGEEYVFTNIGERAYKIIKDSSSSDGKITVPIKVEQHFSAGEQQIFVMSLYQSLAEIRTSELPFVIDTPLARIDSDPQYDEAVRQIGP